MPRRMSNAPVPSMKIQELSSSRPACSACAVCARELGGGLVDQHRELDLRGRDRADVHALLGQRLEGSPATPECERLAACFTTRPWVS